MQKLTLATLGAAVLGFSGFVVDAMAQPPLRQVASAAPVCDAHAVAIYFDRESGDLNEFARALLARAASASRSCGSVVYVEAGAGQPQTRHVVEELRRLGAQPVLQPPRQAALGRDALAAHATMIVIAPVEPDMG